MIVDDANTFASSKFAFKINVWWTRIESNLYCVRPEYTEEEANEESIEDDPMDEQIEGGLYHN